MINHIAGSNYEVGSIAAIGWTSLPMTLIGNLNMETTNVQTFQLPPSVPSTAFQVLIYGYIIAGNSENKDGNARFYTRQGLTTYDQYLQTRGWPQSAHTVTSENMWFPLTDEKTIHVQLSTTFPGNVWGFVNVIGYR